MARRGRAIAVALGVCLLFLLFFSRKSGSHPRDLRIGSFLDATPHKPLHPGVKEPFGPWDPILDQFIHQHNLEDDDMKELDQQIDAIAKGALDLPKEGIQRMDTTKEDKKMEKPLLRNGKEDTGPKVVPKKPGKGVHGSDGMVIIENEEVVVQKYDPAEGIVHLQHVLIQDLKFILTQAPIIVCLHKVFG